jgi:hypothetical protein
MTINRRTMTVGLAALALVGLTSGGIAWAATDAPGATLSGSSGVHCPGGPAVGFGDGSVMTAAADYVGITRTELVDRMRSGESLADIAREEGKTVAGLKEAMVAAMESRLAEDSDLTPAQRTAMLAVTESHLDAMIAGTHRVGMDWDDMRDMMGGGYGMMGGPGNGMMGGRGDGWNGFGGGMMR